MASFNFASLAWRAPVKPTPPPTGDLSFLLAESIAAILLPHLHAALAAYAVRDRTRVLAAYGVGCSILADLLSQEIAMAGWKGAGAAAMRTLAAACAPDETAAENVQTDAAAAWLKRNVEGTAGYGDLCRLFEAAIGEIRQSRMSAKGSITVRAAMARLEAMALSASTYSDLAA